MTTLELFKEAFSMQDLQGYWNNDYVKYPLIGAGAGGLLGGVGSYLNGGRENETNSDARNRILMNALKGAGYGGLAGGGLAAAKDLFTHGAKGVNPNLNPKEHPGDGKINTQSESDAAEAAKKKQEELNKYLENKAHTQANITTGATLGGAGAGIGLGYRSGVKSTESFNKGLDAERKNLVDLHNQAYDSAYKGTTDQKFGDGREAMSHVTGDIKTPLSTKNVASILSGTMRGIQDAPSGKTYQMDTSEPRNLTYPGYPSQGPDFRVTPEVSPLDVHSITSDVARAQANAPAEGWGKIKNILPQLKNSRLARAFGLDTATGLRNDTYRAASGDLDSILPKDKSLMMGGLKGAGKWGLIGGGLGYGLGAGGQAALDHFGPHTNLPIGNGMTTLVKP